MKNVGVLGTTVNQGSSQTSNNQTESNYNQNQTTSESQQSSSNQTQSGGSNQTQSGPATEKPGQLINNQCASSGYVGDDQNCKKFYRCVENGQGGFIKYEFTCGQGTVWDQAIQACNYPYSVTGRCYVAQPVIPVSGQNGTTQEGTQSGTEQGSSSENQSSSSQNQTTSNTEGMFRFLIYILHKYSLVCYNQALHLILYFRLIPKSNWINRSTNELKPKPAGIWKQPNGFFFPDWFNKQLSMHTRRFCGR